MSHQTMMPGTLAALRYNSVLDTDSYKLSHWRGYRPGTRSVYSYIESRGGRYPEVMLAGLQPMLYKMGQPVEDWEIEEAVAFAPKHGLPFHRVGWDKIVNKYDRKLPIIVRAISEGLMVPVQNALITVQNLDDDLAWLTSYQETRMMSDVWTASTIATRIFYMKRRLKVLFDAYSDNPISPFALLDFSRRGTMGYSHAELGAIGHLFHFQGSDNMPGIRHVNHYYGSPMAAWSVNATEHSIACSYGQDNDDDYIVQSIERMVPEGGILSLVGDTWDIFRFAKRLVAHKDIIANKKVSIVCRPDSGEMHDVLPEVFRTMADGFGTTMNSKGKGVLNLNAKVLQGDGIDEETCVFPFLIAKQQGIAPDSVMTGSGGGLATKDLDRDTNRWAMKASEMVIGDTRVEIRKNPITDPGKISKAGRFKLVRNDEGRFITVGVDTRDAIGREDYLKMRFNSGLVTAPAVLSDIRALIDSQL